MKTFKWKRLIYAFLILGLLGACGNSNKSGETKLVNTNTDTIPTGTSGTVPNNLTTVDQFITAVTNGKFAAPSSSSMTYDYVLHSGIYVNNPNVKCKLGGFFCYSISTSSSSNFNDFNYLEMMRRQVSSSTITRESNDDFKQTTLLNLKSALVSKLKTAKSKTVRRYHPIYGTIQIDQYKVLSGNEIVYIENGHCYKIDLTKPLAANPTSKYEFKNDQCTGKGYELIDMY